MKRWILRTICVVFLAPALWAAESLESVVYSVSTGESKPFPRLAKTEFFALDPQTVNSWLIFSHANADFLLLPAYPGSGQEQVMVARGGRIFARGFKRKLFDIEGE